MTNHEKITENIQKMKALHMRIKDASVMNLKPLALESSALNITTFELLMEHKNHGE